MRYLLIDTANTFFRARHAAHRGADSWEKIGYALHITLSSINKVYKKFGADHVVFALEGRSWRKDVYAPYKRNRTESRAAQTPDQREEDQMFWETYDILAKYLADQTNCSLIRHDQAEADDIIARWIDLHPDDDHVIISSDSDFAQLISENVFQYNGITGESIKINGVFDDKDKPAIDKRTKLAKTCPDPVWLLFEKCMRGDSTDNVFSAYPGVRLRGSKNRVGLEEAFQDRDKQGYAWNNLMLQKWVDHDGVEHRVLDDYTRNRQLLDLRAQPPHIKHMIDQAIHEQVNLNDVGQVGTKFMKFCGRFELNRIADLASQYAEWMNLTYKGILHDQSKTSCA